MRSRSRRSSPRRSEGLTLIEICVASALMIFVTLAGSSMLVAGLGYQAVQQNQTDLQRDTMGMLSRMADELSEGDASAFRVDAAPAGIVFASPRDALGRFSYDSSKVVEWQGYVCYYVDSVNGVQCLVRKWSPLGAAVTTAPAVPAAMTTAWFRDQALPRAVVGRHVSSLQLTGSNPLTLSLTAANSGMGRADSLTVSTRVYLRN